MNNEKRIVSSVPVGEQWRTLAGRAVLLALVVVGITGCQAGGQGQDTESFDAFLEELRIYKLDYEVASSPDALADNADLVVRGDVVDVRPGQAYAPLADSPAQIVTSVLHVRVTEVLRGDSSLVSDGMVYLEVPHPARLYSGEDDRVGRPYDLAAFAAVVPRTDGLFFLDDRTNESYWDTVINRGAGRPADASLMAPYPQGFLLRAPDGGLESAIVELEDMPATWEGLATLDDVVEALESKP